MSETLDSRVAAYAATVAEALRPVKETNLGYGTFYVEEVKISFDGEECGIRVVANEHGDFDIEVGADK